MKSFAGSVLVGLILALIACGSYDPDATTQLYQPDYTIYSEQIHPWMTKQCGTLDCHGQTGRPLRVYGARGLRLYDQESRLVPGGTETVPEEIRASYESLIGLEPEATRRVVAGDQDPQTLLIIRKPAGSAPGQKDSLAGERHKGGTVGTTGGAALACLIAWLSIQANDGVFTGTTDCAAARELP